MIWFEMILWVVCGILGYGLVKGLCKDIIKLGDYHKYGFVDEVVSRFVFCMGPFGLMIWWAVFCVAGIVYQKKDEKSDKIIFLVKPSFCFEMLKELCEK